MFYYQIKETRRAVRDSESGLEQMSIGHHIQDRGHVVEKKLNKKTGEKELMQDFQNMDECMSAHCFYHYTNKQANTVFPNMILILHPQLKHRILTKSGSRSCPSLIHRVP